MILAELQGLGLKVELAPGGLRLSGLDRLNKSQAEKALNLAQSRKVEIINALTAENTIREEMTIWPPDLKELFEERAAIMEYDGGLKRKEAERQAMACLAEGK